MKAPQWKKYGHQFWWTNPGYPVSYRLKLGIVQVIVHLPKTGGYTVSVHGHESNRRSMRVFDDIESAKQEGLKLARKAIREQMKMLDILDDK